MNCTKKLDIRKIIARIDPPNVPSSVRPAAAASALARQHRTVALEQVGAQAR